MKLIDLLVDIFDAWPEGVAEVMQDYDGAVKGSEECGSDCYDNDDVHIWMRPFGVGPSFGHHPVAEDAATTLVAEKEWTLEAVRRGKKMLKTAFTEDVARDDVVPAPKKSEAELLWDRVHSGEQKLSDGVEMKTKWMVYVPDYEGCEGGPFLYSGCQDQQYYGPSVFKSEEDAERAIQRMVTEHGYKREDYHIISFNVPKIRGK